MRTARGHSDLDLVTAARHSEKQPHEIRGLVALVGGSGQEGSNFALSDALFMLLPPRRTGNWEAPRIYLRARNTKADKDKDEKARLSAHLPRT